MLISSKTLTGIRPSRTAQTEQSFLCSECGKALSCANALNRHLKSRHGMGRQWYCQQPGCEKENKPYGRVDHFKLHMKNAHKMVISSREARKRFLLDGSPANRRSESSPMLGRSSSPADESRDVETQHLPDPDINEHVRGRNSTAKKSVKNAILTQKRAIPPIDEGEFESIDRDELIDMIQSQRQVCYQLREKCRALTQERNEYAEALRLSKERRHNRRLKIAKREALAHFDNSDV